VGGGEGDRRDETHVLTSGVQGRDSAGGRDFAHAMALTAGQPVTSSVVKGTDSYYQFALAQGQSATVTMTPLDSDLDLFGYGPGPTSDPMITSGKGDREVEQITFVNASQGVHYAVVSAFTSSRFKILLEVQTRVDLPSAPLDAGDRFATAIALAAGDTKTGRVEKGAKHYYRFDLDAGQTVTVTMQPLQDDLDLFGYGPNSQSETIANSGNGQTQTEAMVMTATDAGRYYAVVDGFSTSTYTITLN